MITFGTRLSMSGLRAALQRITSLMPAGTPYPAVSTRAILVIAAVTALGLAARPARAQIDPSPAITAAVAAGHHWRFETTHGVVHVWTPDGYDPRTAAIVAYVHGYYTDVDRAWMDHRLPEQFALSGINAMFIACEAPAGKSELVSWRSLPALLQVVTRGTGQPLPRGRRIAVGHSGAFRTLESWLADPALDTIVLLDAVYDLDPFRAWIRASQRRRLIDIGADTVRFTDELHRTLPSTYVVDALPPPEAGALPPEAAAARIVYVRSQVGHMPLVTGGVALPMVLRATSVDQVATAPSRQPLGVLPPAPAIASCDDH
jgi:hypothetical protein